MRSIIVLILVVLLLIFLVPKVIENKVEQPEITDQGVVNAGQTSKTIIFLSYDECREDVLRNPEDYIKQGYNPNNLLKEDNKRLLLKECHDVYSLR